MKAWNCFHTFMHRPGCSKCEGKKGDEINFKNLLDFFYPFCYINISHGKVSVYPLIMKKKKIKTKIKSTKSLEKLAKKGFQGYPIATVACYGPDDQHATKAAVGIVYNEEGDPIDMKRWYSETIDVRRDPTINLEVYEFIKEKGA